MKILTLIGGLVLVALIVAGVGIALLFALSRRVRSAITKTFQEWSNS